MLPDASRAITREDVESGRTWYIQQTDTDAKVIRFHGPFLLLDAQTKAENFRAARHDAYIMDTPGRLKRALTGAKA